MLNYVWLAFLVVAVLVGGFTGKLPELTSGAFEGAVKAVMNVVLPLLGIWAIWLGMMRLAERAGLVQALAWALRPLMGRLFPDVPRDHPAVGAMVMNMAANMLGLGNAATPLGLRAMRLLESLNPNPGVATNAMCTFLALNTASIQILPLTAIGILVTAGGEKRHGDRHHRFSGDPLRRQRRRAGGEVFRKASAISGDGAVDSRGAGGRRGWCVA